MKYKIEDEVRIIGSKAQHHFNIGDDAIIIEIDENDDICTYLCAGVNNGADVWWVAEDDIEPAVVYQYLIVNILSGIMFTSEDEDEQYLFTKEQVVEHLNNDIAYPSQWTIVSADKTFNVNSIMEEEVK